jgi:hypothetical protein
MRPTAEHKLKSHPEAFEATRLGLKGFDFRRDDRDFQVGDTLLLQEFEPLR